MSGYLKFWHTTNADLQYDFRRLATHTITVSNAWGSGSQDIMGDIDGACNKVRQDGRSMPDMMVLGGGAMDLFIKDTTVKALADNRRFELIEVSTNNPVPPKFAKFIAAGFIARGRLRTPTGYELWMFTYLDSYENSAGTATLYMPTDKALICDSQARCDRYFGPPEILPFTAQKIAFYQEMFGINPMAAPMPLKMRAPGNVVDPAMFYVDAYASNDWTKVTLRTQSAPIFATTQTDAFVTLDGLV